MINAIEEMTIFNAIRGPDRRESYFPTRIGGITWYESNSSSGADGYKKEHDKYVIRIPLQARIQDGRRYLPEEQFRSLPQRDVPKYWTLREGDYIFPKMLYSKRWKFNDFSFRTGIITDDMFETSIFYGKGWKFDDFNFRYGCLAASPINDIGTYMKKKYGKLIVVTEFADNTKRGSDKVRHWKVGAS